MNCFKSSAFDGGSYERDEQPSFMSCILRVDSERRGSHRSVAKILKSIKDVRSCRLGEDELLEVTGFVYPRAFMKALGKAKNRMELKWIQFGQCSSFLYGPDLRQFQKEAPPVMASCIDYASPAGGIGYPFRQGYYAGVPPPSYYGHEGISPCSMM